MEPRRVPGKAVWAERTAVSLQHVAAITHAAGAAKPADVDEFDATPEREQQRQLARTRGGQNAIPCIIEQT